MVRVRKNFYKLIFGNSVGVLVDEKLMKNIARLQFETKERLLDLLENLGTISKTKARQLVYYPVPMSLIRWGNYLTPAQAEKYLVPFEEETNISDSDMGI